MHLPARQLNCPGLGHPRKTDSQGIQELPIHQRRRVRRFRTTEHKVCDSATSRCRVHARRHAQQRPFAGIAAWRTLCCQKSAERLQSGWERRRESCHGKPMRSGLRIRRAIHHAGRRPESKFQLPRARPQPGASCRHLTPVSGNCTTNQEVKIPAAPFPAALFTLLDDGASPRGILRSHRMPSSCVAATLAILLISLV